MFGGGLTAFFGDDPEAVLRAAGSVLSQSAGEIDHPDTFNPRTNKPVGGGIYCARVFGPVEDLRCSCAFRKGEAHRGETCPECGVLCGDSGLRQERWAHVTLPTAVVHPALWPRVATELGCRQADLKRVLRRSHAFSEDGELVPPLGHDGPVTRISDRLGPDSPLLFHAVPVVPAGWRPPTAADNDAYRRLINRKNRMDRLLELGAPEILLLDEARKLQLAFERLIVTVRTELAARQRRPARRTRKTEALLAAVYADPHSDEPRAVYADHLQEVGDPRGEFITLQLDNATRARMSREESAILRRHQAEWLGPLSEVLEPRVKFRRGFAVRCRTRSGLAEEVRALADHPAWSTVEHLGSGVVELFTSPSLRSLRSIDVTFSVLKRLCMLDAPLEHIEAATVRLASCPPRGCSDVTDTDALAGLSELTMVHKRADGPHDWDWLASSALVRRLRAVTVVNHIDSLTANALAPWIPTMKAELLDEVTVSFGQRQIAFTLERSQSELAIGLHMTQAGADRLSWDEGPLREAILNTVASSVGVATALALSGTWYAESENSIALVDDLKAHFPNVAIVAAT